MESGHAGEKVSRVRGGAAGDEGHAGEEAGGGVFPVIGVWAEEKGSQGGLNKNIPGLAREKTERLGLVVVVVVIRAMYAYTLMHWCISCPGAGVGRSRHDSRVTRLSKR